MANSRNKLIALCLLGFYYSCCAVQANEPSHPKETNSVSQGSSPVSGAVSGNSATKSQEANPGNQPDARKLFAEKSTPSEPPAISIGQAACGCLAGAVKLPSDGKGWQVMRLSRNRYWGHPSMIEYIQNLGTKVEKVGWKGLLIGDLSMPRGGPMPSGHASHQRGTDADIWLTPAPRNKLSNELRETLSAGSVLKVDSAELDMSIWSPAHANFVRTAAQDDNVARIFVTPAIKKYLCSCKKSDGSDTDWLRRLRPWEGHDDHIHVRLKCPSTDPCVEQEAPPEGDGCGEELTEWMQKTAKDPPFKSVPAKDDSENPPFALNKMPKQCLELLK